MRIIVTGLIAQHYTLGGVTWDYLQYLIGLKQLGHEVYYFEDSGEWPYTLDGGTTGNDWVAKNCDKNINYLKKVLNRYGLGESWAYFFPIKSKWYGLTDHKRKTIIKTADLLLNVSGALVEPEKYHSIKKLIYIDSDPGFTQIKLKLGEDEFSKRVAAHHVHFSFGETISDAFSNLDYDWKPTRSPILLSEWIPSKTKGNIYSTIMNWTSYKPLHYDGKCYNQKDMEFIKFLKLPTRLKNISFEVALSKLQHKNWQTFISQSITGAKNQSNLLFNHPTDLLSYYGWQLVNPEEKCNNIDSYRDYILSSKGEWSVSKGGYVVSNSGWFSCRSACYLAAGKPVIVQNTGFDRVLPVGVGILQFSTLEEAIDAVNNVETNYSTHSKRAREIAVEYFNSDKVLQHLLDRAFEH
ncbi:MAG: hypothetical protein JWN56_2770 [Sphingobacteriales bacterium]|nr:hypothetical protein [Sphingobacteriales bacterium]